MQDIDAIARYWESELPLAGSRETRVLTIASPIGALGSGRTSGWATAGGSRPSTVRSPTSRPLNRHLLARWRQRVRPGDTIICLGDIAHLDGWRDQRLVLDLRACPGERVLILGNDDRDVPARRCVELARTRPAGPRCAPPIRRWC